MGSQFPTGGGGLVAFPKVSVTGAAALDIPNTRLFTMPVVMVVIEQFSPAAAGGLAIQLMVAGVPRATASDYSWQHGVRIATLGSYGEQFNASDTMIDVSSASIDITVDRALWGNVTLFNPSNTVAGKHLIFNTVWKDSVGGRPNYVDGFGILKAVTSAVDGIRLLLQGGGNFDAVARPYGLLAA